MLRFAALLWIVCFSAHSTASPKSAADPRIITAGGTITEIVFALGAGESVVAVDQSSQYPAAATDLPMVGYYRELAAEGVLAFMPDKLMALEGAGSPEVLEQIAAIGVDVRIYAKPKSVDDLMSLIAELGDDLNRQNAATLLQTKIQSSLPVKKQLSDTKAVYLLSAGDRGLIAAGKETVPQLLFDYNGIQNLASSHFGFKGLNSESLALQQPDFLVAPEHVVRGMGGRQAFCQAAVLRLLSAAQECRLLVMDSLMSLGMTPRLAKAIEAVNRWEEVN
ncbi:hemin-binding protein [Planctobacterium marinum]|uniref:Hemin-binding protein n=2 Tax=Planctobacterium marinum TaxID=1631968 RepID=A0AA48KTD6_9ALTE|nr:hemin-binding protein [Planctobacterium marinum]